MKNFAKWLLKSLLVGAAWVFILSLPIRSQMLFDHAHELLIENSLVGFIDEKVNDTWEDLRVVALSALSEKRVEKGIESF